MPAVPTDFAAAVKGKRSVATAQDAIDTELVRAKLAANEIADRIALNLTLLDEHVEHASLFPDQSALVLKARDDLQAVITARIAEHTAREQKRRDAEDAASQAVAAASASSAAVAAQAPAPTPAAVAPVYALRRSTPPAVDEPATLNLGAINSRLGLGVTAAGLAELGITHVATDKSAKLFRESQFPAICDALIAHIARVRDGSQRAA